MTTANATELQAAIRNKIFQAFPREVIKMPLMGPDNCPSPHYGLCFDDATSASDWCRNTVKKNYRPHTREDLTAICETVATGIDLPLDQISISCAWKNGYGHRIAVQPTTEYRRSICGTDTIFPKFIVRANYGGAFVASVGMYRDLCKNMQMLRKVEGTTVHLRHVSNFQENFDATVEQWQHLAAKFDNIVEAAQQLEQVRANVGEFYDTLYPQPELATKRSINSHRKQIESMLGRLVDERLKADKAGATDTRTATLWELVNSVTGYVQHDRSRRGKLSDDARAFAAVDDPSCDKAWDLAFQLAN
jgi:hypothetical protein